jgi:ribonuclease III
MSWLDRLLKKSPDSAQADLSETDIAALEQRIGYSFTDKSLLVRALRHRSYVYHAVENHTPELEIQANERLEFLGDAVLGLATTIYLYQRFPDKPEGELTKRKSVLVSKSVLARRAVAFGLDQAMLLSDTEESAGGRKRRSILGDGFEAVLGALFLDGGLEPAQVFLEQQLFTHTDELIRDATFINYKSLLLEHVQADGTSPPEYRLCSQEGPDHKKVFTVDAVVAGEILGRGLGRSKKDAQQFAAKKAYERLSGESFGEMNTSGRGFDPSTELNGEEE